MMVVTYSYLATVLVEVHESMGVDDTFGEQIPFCEPYWYQGGFSPYYTDAHKRFRHVCREFCEKEIKPHLDEWIAKKEYPQVLRAQSTIGACSRVVRCTCERNLRAKYVASL
jgi:hypothetical protein